jgi:hypothetical protein
MRWLGRMICLGGMMVWAVAAWADSARITKLLPHFLDRDGRHTLSPSLYERDAYQAYLLQHPELRFGMRFDLLFRVPPTAKLAVRLELRGSKNNKPTVATVESSPFKHRGGRSWKTVYLRGEDYRQFGELLAWRATLWEGDRLLAEQKSFLW